MKYRAVEELLKNGALKMKKAPLKIQLDVARKAFHWLALK